MTGPALAAAHPYGSFLKRLGEAMAERRKDGQTLALLFVDLDAIDRTDRLGGYLLGDAVRERFSRRLRGEVLRAHDFLGEISRDELACVLESVPSPGVPLLAAEKLLRVLDEPVLADVHEIHAQPAVGIALFDGGTGSPVELLSEARAAFHEAQRRAERVAMFDPGERPAGAGDDSAQRTHENRLRAAVARQRLSSVFEPQAECRSGRLVGVEAKLAWADGEHGVVHVEDALRVATWSGRSAELIERVFNDALRNCGDFRQTAGLDLRVTVGIPVSSLRDAGLAELVARALKTWNLRAGRLTVTVSDAAGLLNDESAAQGLRELADTGIRIGLDMRGIGPSELAPLAALPLGEIRFPAAPFEAAEAGSNADGIVRSLIELARKLRLETLAFGVSSSAFSQRLDEMGCDCVQGPLIGPALDPVRFADRFGV